MLITVYWRVGGMYSKCVGVGGRTYSMWASSLRLYFMLHFEQFEQIFLPPPPIFCFCFCAIISSELIPAFIHFPYSTQSKIRKRSWVLHECVERVPENVDAAKELLQYGLKGTDLEALIAIGNREDGGRYGRSRHKSHTCTQMQSEHAINFK